MRRESPGAFPLFDLLSRRWRLPAEPRSLQFNATGTAIAAALADGRIALVDVADAEPPDKRIAIDEAGRRAIAPRRTEPRPAIVLPATRDAPAKLAATRENRFLAARGDGRVVEIAADGAETPKRKCDDGEAFALDHVRGQTAVVSEGGVAVGDRHGGAEWGARCVAISPGGLWLAFGAGAILLLTRVTAPFEIVARHECGSAIERIVWRQDSQMLAAACGQAGIALLELGGRFATLGDFPTPPHSIAFHSGANALVSSGAFRIVAWDLAHPPFNGDRSGALETGRPGLISVVEIAVHPTRKLVAAGWANGQIAIAALGGRDELILQPAGRTPTALAWSSDGRTLAIAAEDGLSLVSMPDALFK